MTTLSEARAARRPVQVSVPVPLRPDLADEIALLEGRLRHERQVDQRENRQAVAPQLAEAIQVLEGELAASEVVFTFVGIGRRAYAALLAQYPPTEQDKRDAEAAGNVAVYDLNAFPPRLLHDACIAPADSTMDDWTDIWENWSEGQVTKLWRACVAAQNGAGDVGPKSVIASSVLRELGLNSTTADLEESPDPSS